MSLLASDQTEAAETTNKCATQPLDYIASHRDTKVQYRPSNIIMNIHSDASYLSQPKKGKPIKVNGDIYVSTGISQVRGGVSGRGGIRGTLYQL